MGDPYEDQSFKNMVWFFQDELRLILDGALAKSVLGKSLRFALRKHNVLRRGGGQGCQSTVSAEAQSLLMDFTH